ncbi:MAG: MFS transporter, partial [Gluconobacter potus]|uniref:MFS transporter n=3 Tax=Gluconobacter TaxID=441 RepID=UPI0039EC7506
MLFDELSVQKFHIRVLIAGACGIFTDGYVLGSISPALPSLTSALHLSPHQTGLVASAPLAGLLFGSLLASPILDKIGRRLPFAFDMMAFVFLALFHALTSDLTSLLILRFIIGCLLGIDYVAGKLYVSEFLPSASRGRLMSWLSVAWVGGYTSAYAIGYVMHLAWPQGTWTIIFMSAALPALCAALLRYGMPESILWLLSQRRIADARRIADRYFGAVELPPRSSGTPSSGRSGTLGRVVQLFSGRQWPRSIGATLFYVLHNVPYLVLSAFLPEVLRNAGLHDPFKSGLFYDALLLSGSVIGLWIVERFRRRSLIVGSFVLQGSCLFIIS